MVGKAVDSDINSVKSVMDNWEVDILRLKKLI